MTTKQEQWIGNFAEFLSSDEHREIVIQNFAKRFDITITRARVVVNSFWMQQIQAA
jgi:hypothetical protein